MKKYSLAQVVCFMIAQAILGAFIAAGLRTVTVEAQQTPFTMYPLHAKVQIPFTDQTIEVQQCLVVTAQGHAVVLEYPCPQ